MLQFLSLTAFICSASGQVDPNADIPRSMDVSIPIGVPPFHGTEPALALEYSGTAYELAGTGWRLRGFPVIERRSRGRGGPNFVASDVYVLDDVELFACAPGVTSPSCSTGGTHYMRHESYTRIAYSATANAWTITARGGTRTVFEPLGSGTTPETTLRWGIRRVIDAHDNAVEYEWTCYTGPACVPSSVRYGGTTITLYSEHRPDSYFLSNGAALFHQPYRIKTIEARRDTEGVARVYALAYDDNLSNRASLITSVSEYGRDAVVAADGRVTAGTALPPHRMTYNPDGASFALNSGHAPAAGLANGYLDTPATTNTFADIDGDGRIDFITYDSQTGVWGWSVRRFDGSTFAYVSHLPRPAGAASSLRGSNNALADFDGDGRTDLLTYDTVGGAGYTLRLSDGTSFVSTSHLAKLTGGSNCLSGSCANAVADVNGDGRMDLLLYESAPPAVPRWVVFISNGAGFDRAGALAVPSGAARELSGTNALRDLDGDGRIDLLTWDTADTAIDSTARGFTPWLSDGSGFVRGRRLIDATIADQCLDAAPCTNALVDVNGDGRVDLVTRRTGTGRNFDVRLSDGTGFWTSGSFTLSGAYGDDLVGGTNSFGDISGDGLVDLVAYRAGGGGWLLFLSTGGSLTAASSSAFMTPGLYTGYLEAGSSAPTNALTDVNGDGRADLVTYDSTGGWGYSIWLSSGTWFELASHVLPPSMYAGYLRGSTNVLADIDGDLKTDLVTYDSRDGSWGYTIHPISGGPANALATITSPSGGRTSFEWAPERMVGPGGSFVVPRVSAVHRDDGRGRVATTRYSYEGGRFEAAERRSLGFAREVATDAAGSYRETRFLQTLAGAGRPIEVAFRDAAGVRLTSSSYTYDEAAAPPYRLRLRTRSDFECDSLGACREARVDLTYDGYGNVTEVRDRGDVASSGDDRTTSFTFAPNTTAYVVAAPSTSRVFRGLGTAGAKLAETRFFYDGAMRHTTPPSRGDLTRRDEWLDRTGAFLSTTNTYDGYGNLRTSTNARGSRTTFGYDPTYHVFLTETCNALGHCTTTRWDTVLGRPLVITDPNGFATTHTYDANARITRTTYANGGYEETRYVALGDPAAQYIEARASDGSADGLWSRRYLDGFGRVHERRREGGYRQLVEYEAEYPARVRRESPWFGAAETAQYETYAYDAFGRLTTATHPDGTARTRSYGLGSVTARDERGGERTELRNARGRLAVVSERNGAASHDTRYAYDARDRLVSVTDAAGNASTTQYDSLGRVTRECDPDRGCRTFTHNEAGSVLTRVDPSAQTLAYTYDALERVLTKTRPDATVDRFTYDEVGHSGGIGRLTTTSYPGGNEDVEYDFAGRSVLHTRCRGEVCYTLETTYDTTGRGRLSSVIYPDEAVSYTYNAAGELASAPGYVTGARFDARGALTQLDLENGTRTTYAFDPRRFRLTSQSVRLGTTAIYDASYSYNADSTVSSLTTSNGGAAQTLDFTYDDLDRLVAVGGAQTQTLAYDSIGNVTSNSLLGAYTYRAAHPHAAVTAGPNSYTYDANGNMLTGAGRTFEWNADDRITSIATASGTSTFGYDAGGERTSKRVGSSTALYFGELMEYDGSALTKYVFFGPLRVARRVAIGPKTFYHVDQVGSPRALTSSTGTAVRRITYRPFGDVVSESGTYAQPIGFGDQHRDAETGLVYMNARYYDPVLSRFVSADPIVPGIDDPQAHNRYSYVLNNPVAMSDPSGHGGVNGPTGGIHNDGGYGQHGYNGSSHGDPDSPRGKGGGVHDYVDDGRLDDSDITVHPDFIDRLRPLPGSYPTSSTTAAIDYNGLQINYPNTTDAFATLIGVMARIDDVLASNAGALLRAMGPKVFIALDQAGLRAVGYNGTEIVAGFYDQWRNTIGILNGDSWAITHELGHFVDSYGLTEGQRRRVDQEYTRLIAAGSVEDFPSDYAQRSVGEFFAEGVSRHFAPNPDSFYSNSPGLHDVLNEVFGEN